MAYQSELDDDFDTCDECVLCGHHVQQAGHHLCDHCEDEEDALINSLDDHPFSGRISAGDY